MPCHLRRGMTLQCYSDASVGISVIFFVEEPWFFDKNKTPPANPFGSTGGLFWFYNKCWGSEPEWYAAPNIFIIGK